MGHKEKKSFLSFYKTCLLAGLPLLFLLASCSHTPFSSGHYILLEEGDTVETIAMEFGIPQDTILLANRHKDFVSGEWIFIPLSDRGLIPQLRGEGGSSYGNSGGQFGGKFLWPVPMSGKVSSLYGQRGEKFHHGIDIPAPTGSLILAAEDGKVIHSGRKLRGFGNLTIISHGDDLYTIYAHAQRNFTKVGEKIERGQVIGEVGSTGKSSGPHLHFEVRRQKKSVDPLEFLPHSMGQAN